MRAADFRKAAGQACCRCIMTACATKGASQSERPVLRLLAAIGAAFVGVTLLVCALAANQRWLDRHFLPAFFWHRHWIVLEETSARMAAAILGIVLSFGARARIASCI